MLLWEQQDGGSWWGWSGQLVIALVVKQSDGRWVYSVSGVSTRRITKGYGNVATDASAKRSADRAWKDWLGYAALQPSN